MYIVSTNYYSFYLLCIFALLQTILQDLSTSPCHPQNADPFCKCTSCHEVCKAISQLTDPKKSFSCPSDVRLGARVLVRGRYAGIIRYVGDLDSNFVNSKIYIGVKLDDPGEHREIKAL